MLSGLLKTRMASNWALIDWLVSRMIRSNPIAVSWTTCRGDGSHVMCWPDVLTPFIIWSCCCVMLARMSGRRRRSASRTASWSSAATSASRARSSGLALMTMLSTLIWVLALVIRHNIGLKLHSVETDIILHITPRINRSGCVLDDNPVLRSNHDLK